MFADHKGIKADQNRSWQLPLFAAGSHDCCPFPPKATKSSKLSLATSTILQDLDIIFTASTMFQYLDISGAYLLILDFCVIMKKAIFKGKGLQNTAEGIVCKWDRV